MSKPELARAARRVAAPVTAEVGLAPATELQLNLIVRDPECVRELSVRNGRDREEYALACLRVGVQALRLAGGAIDSQSLRNEGERLVEAVKGKLDAHAQTLNTALKEKLEAYFDPANGHFPTRVKALVGEDGELARLLKDFIKGDNSMLARQLALAVGKDSEFMKHLSPTQKDGLIEKIATLARDRLEEQSRKVLGEFDLNNPQGALKRLISQIETNFNPNEPASAMGLLNKALKATQEQIRRDLTLDDDTSSLARLQASLKQQIDDMLAKQAAFQSAIYEKLGVKQVQARTTEGGFGFEHAAGAALQRRAAALNDLFESVGESVGITPRSKIGDHVLVLGADTRAPGTRIVFECKRDNTYTLASALKELEAARANRQAEIGVFIMSAATLRDAPKLRQEYGHVLARFDNDIIAVWDDENPHTDVVLDAALALARALAVRGKAAVGEESEVEWEKLDRALAGMEKQLEFFEDMNTWCDNITRDAGKIKGRLEKISEGLERDLERVNEQINNMRV